MPTTLKISFVALATAALACVTAAVVFAGTSFGPGTQIVGRDVEPGTYESAIISGDTMCRWQRLKGFSGEFSDFITGDVVMSGRAVVTIEPTDKGFTSQDCGTWKRVR